MDPRDIAIRTILGEAIGESPQGQAAVAHILLNRARDPRWPSTVHEVAMQPNQFSAWNAANKGGNEHVRKHNPGSDPYQKAAAIYDGVLAGNIADPTGAATHYYSPVGMDALVEQGVQSNRVPRWFAEETRRRGAEPTTIGNQIFTGRADGTPYNPQAEEVPEWLAGVFGDEDTALADFGQSLTDMGQPQAPIWLDKPQAPPIAPVRRDTTAPYMNLFEAMRHA